MNPIHKISNSNYDSQNVKSKILSINLRVDGLSFVIMESDSIMIAECYEWQSKDWEYATQQYKEVFFNNSIFKKEFKRVIIILNTVENTLIPIKFHDKSKETIVLKTLLGIDNFGTFSFKLKNEDAILLTAINNSLNELIHNVFPEFDLISYSSFFIDEAINYSEKKDTVMLNIAQQSFEIINTKSKKIIAHNYFDFTTADEFMFFVLSVIKQNNIDIENIQLLLSGKISMDSKIGKSLEKYFPTIKQLQKVSANDKEAAFKELKKYTLIANS